VTLLTRAGALALFFGLGAFARPAPAQTYTFTKIVDTANTSFDPFGFGAPAINDAGQVAFKATDVNTNVQGIFRGSGGPLTPIADNAGSLNFIGRLPSINNAGEVAFAATVTGGNEQIYRGSGGPLVTIAETTGSPKFFAFNTSLNNVGSVAFQAELDNFEEGLFHGNGGPVTTVFTTSTSPFNVSFGSPSINDAGQIAFQAGRDVGDGGIFRFDPATNTFATIVTDTGTFSTPDDRPSMNAAGRVAFQSLINGGTGEGIFLGDGGPVVTIADSSGAFQFFARPSLNDAGQVAFSATLDDNREGLFDGPDPVADRILVAGQTFDGGVIEGILVDREGLNNSGQITFFVGFDGGTRAAIYVATPVPEPTAACVVLIGLASVSMRRARS
jgi:hypothetical protein